MYNSPENGFDTAKKVVTDESGNVYVTGTSGGASLNGDDPINDILTVKYDSMGIKLWEARYNSPGNNADIASAIAVDQSGNVYVAGASIRSDLGTSWDYVTIKYNSDGVEQWTARYNGSDNADLAMAIAVDEGGNVYVTGNSAHRFGRSGFDIATVKYNSAGIQQWGAIYNDWGDDFVTSMASWL